jgi:hypothetical protein
MVPLDSLVLAECSLAKGSVFASPSDCSPAPSGDEETKDEHGDVVAGRWDFVDHMCPGNRTPCCCPKYVSVKSSTLRSIALFFA